MISDNVVNYEGYIKFNGQFYNAVEYFDKDNLGCKECNLNKSNCDMQCEKYCCKFLIKI